MKYKFQELQSSWGIHIVVDVNDIAGNKLETDINVLKNIYIRINTDVLKPNIIAYWFSLAISDFFNEFPAIIKNDTVCYDINAIEFLHTDFQEEGLYYAMYGWLSQRYMVKMQSTGAYYSKEKNKYIFPKLKGSE